MIQVTLTGIVTRLTGLVMKVMVVVMTINMMMVVMVAVRMETVMVETEGDIKGKGDIFMRQRPLPQLLRNCDAIIIQSSSRRFSKSREGLIFFFLVFPCLFHSSRFVIFFRL